DIAAALDLQKQQQLIQAFGIDYIKNHPVTEDMVKQEYERQKILLANKKEYKVRHILSKTEADAKAIIEQLKSGKSFEKLAKEKSTDAGTKSQGGSLDWITQVSKRQLETCAIKLRSNNKHVIFRIITAHFDAPLLFVHQPTHLRALRNNRNHAPSS